jgi:hypothetical protein
METGKTYLSRSSERVTIIENLGGTEYPIVGLTEKKVLKKYTKTGHFINKSFPHKDDLVTEV